MNELGMEQKKQIIKLADGDTFPESISVGVIIRHRLTDTEWTIVKINNEKNKIELKKNILGRDS